MTLSKSIILNIAFHLSNYLKFENKTIFMPQLNPHVFLNRGSMSTARQHLLPSSNFWMIQAFKEIIIRISCTFIIFRILKNNSSITQNLFAKLIQLSFLIVAYLRRFHSSLSRLSYSSESELLTEKVKSGALKYTFYEQSRIFNKSSLL